MFVVVGFMVGIVVIWSRFFIKIVLLELYGLISVEMGLDLVNVVLFREEMLNVFRLGW